MAGSPQQQGRYAETIQALDNAYPDGWRSGDKTTDAMTVILAAGVRSALGALLGGRR